MKLTKTQLKQIIKEEMDKVIHESQWDAHPKLLDQFLTHMSSHNDKIKARVAQHIKDTPELSGILKTHPDHAKELIDAAWGSAMDGYLSPNDSEDLYHEEILMGFSEVLRDIDPELSDELYKRWRDT